MTLVNQSIASGYVKLVDATSGASPSAGLLLVLPDSELPVSQLNFVNPDTGAVTEVYFKEFSGAPRSELMFVSNGAGLNTIGVQNMNNAGYSAFIGRGADEVEHFALGYGNPGGAPAETVYLETSYFTGATHNTPPPDFQMRQTGYLNGSYQSMIVMDIPGEATFDSKYYIQWRQMDGGIGMRWCRDTGSLGIGLNFTGPAARLDVLGSVVFGNSNTNRVSDADAYLNVIATGADMMRFVKVTVGRVDFQINGTGATVDYDIVDAFGNTPMSINVGSGGRGNTEIRRISSATLQASTSYANDAAAAAGGVPIGECYRNGSVVQIRIT